MDGSDDISRDRLIVCVVIGIIGMIGLIGNILILRTLYAYRQMRIAIYVMIGGLALASTVYIVYEIPHTIVGFTENGWLIPDVWCNIIYYVSYSSLFVIAYHLVALTVLRALSLTNRPNQKLNGTHALIISIAIWVVAFLAGIPLVYIFEKNQELNACSFKPETNINMVILLLTGVSYLVPLALIVVTYLATYYVRQRFFEDSIPEEECRLSTLVTGMVFAYLFCQLPFHAVNISLSYKLKHAQQAGNFDFDHKTWNTVLEYLLCLAQLSVAISPIICAKFSKDFGDSFDEVINCTCCHSGPVRLETTEVFSTTPLTCSTALSREDEV